MKRSTTFPNSIAKSSRSLTTTFVDDLQLDSPQTSPQTSCQSSNSDPTNMDQMLAIGSATKKCDNADQIINQGRIQLINPRLPHSSKQQLFNTLFQIDAYGEEFKDAPAAIHNMLILQIKAALAYSVDGVAFAQHQIRSAYCEQYDLAPPTATNYLSTFGGNSSRSSKSKKHFRK